MLFARKRPLYPFVFLRSCLCYCFFQLRASRPAPCCSLRLLSLLPVNSFHLTTLDPCRAHYVRRPPLPSPQIEQARTACLHVSKASRPTRPSCSRKKVDTPRGK